MEVITYEIQQQVKVRKYNVDCQKLCDLLRKHKKMASLSNKEIAETLNIPITKVEHWFRQDSCFSIPDECTWFELKKLLKITNNEFDLAITTFEEKDNVFEKGNRIYDSQGICPTITCLDSLVVLDRRKQMEVKVIGQMDNTIDHTFESANRVYDVWGVSPTINTCGGGGLQPKIIDDTYANRQPRVYEDYSPALRSERGGLKTIETISTKGKQIEVASTILAGYERTNMTGFNADNGVIEIVKIKQATSQGYIECEVGGVADLSFPDSKTRRCRVQENGQVSPTLMAGEQDICRIENLIIGGEQKHQAIKKDGVCTCLTSSMGTGGGYVPMIAPQYRIRKLTPRECWRLMDFTDEDFEKAAQVNSNTQLYKQAGNSIVKNVLVAIFGKMLLGKENIYKEN